MKIKRKPGPKAYLIGRRTANFIVDAKTIEVLDRIAKDHGCTRSDALRRIVAAIKLPRSGSAAAGG